jgi:uncharacterized protein (TIGR02246 family)
MSARTIPLAVLALALASTACQPPAQEPAALSEEDVAAIRAVAESYTEATLANDYAAVAAHYTQDAVLMSPNQPLIDGRAAIQAALEGLPGTVTEYSSTPVEIEGRGDLAYARGAFTQARAIVGMAERVRDTAKYLVILRKQPDGSWLLTEVCWNSDLPLPEMSAEPVEIEE